MKIFYRIFFVVLSAFFVSCQTSNKLVTNSPLEISWPIEGLEFTLDDFAGIKLWSNSNHKFYYLFDTGAPYSVFFSRPEFEYVVLNEKDSSIENYRGSFNLNSIYIPKVVIQNAEISNWKTQLVTNSDNPDYLGVLGPDIYRNTSVEISFSESRIYIPARVHKNKVIFFVDFVKLKDVDGSIAILDKPLIAAKIDGGNVQPLLVDSGNIVSFRPIIGGLEELPRDEIALKSKIKRIFEKIELGPIALGEIDGLDVSTNIESIPSIGIRMLKEFKSIIVDLKNQKMGFLLF